MSLRPQDIEQVPTETADVTRAAFPKGHAYLTLRDKFGTLFPDELLRKLFAWRGQPAEAPGRLAVVTVLQFAEGLSDQQAADAVRSRLDWKYLLALALKDPGLDASVLSEFRSRRVAGGAEHLLLERVLKQFEEAGLLKAGGRARTDATHVLAAVRTLHRLDCVGETLRQALDVLAAVVNPQLKRASWSAASTIPSFSAAVKNRRRALATTSAPAPWPKLFTLSVSRIVTQRADDLRLLQA